MTDSLLSEHVYLDTGVLVAASMSLGLHAVAGREFCQRLVVQRSQVYYSQVLLLEFSEAIRKLATIPGRVPPGVVDQFGLTHWQRSPRVRESWMQSGLAQLDNLLERFDQVYELPFHRSLWIQSIGLMTRLQIRSHDAIHLATAYEYRIPCVATTDAEFVGAPDLDVRLIRDSGTPP